MLSHHACARRRRVDPHRPGSHGIDTRLLLPGAVVRAMAGSGAAAALCSWGEATILVMCADVQAMPPTDEQVEQAVGTLAMLADPTRIRLLWALLDGELPVHDLA